jgi:hypothetical protein
MGLTDLSGRSIPSPSALSNGNGGGNGGGDLSRVVAIPPVRQTPNEVAQEFLFSGFANLAAGGVAFVQLTDPVTGLAFAERIPDQSKGRLDSLMIFCPDMVAAATPYLFVQLVLNAQPASAWGFIPVFPRAGVASIEFDTMIDLTPNVVLGLFAENVDAVNTHFVAVYLHGWIWPKDYVDA